MRGGVLFAILPGAPVTLKSGLGWRRRLLQRHTLRVAIKMPNDLFQPNVSKGTWAIIIEAGRPHKVDDEVYFAILRDDDSAAFKSKTLGLEARDNMDRIESDVKAFLAGNTDLVSDVALESCKARLKMSGNLDFSPESYVPNEVGEMRSPEDLFVALARRTFRNQTIQNSIQEKTWLHIQDLFQVHKGNAPTKKELSPGNVPLITTTESNNGIVGYFDVKDATKWKNAITISANGSGGFACWHPYEFAASTDVMVCTWLEPTYKDPALALYVCNEINNNHWRYDYYRKCSRERLLSDVSIGLPMKGDLIDLEKIQSQAMRIPGFTAIQEMVKSELSKQEEDTLSS